jgi:hypothetical protein
MPPGDLEAARRLAVVLIEPPHAFINNEAAVRAALSHISTHLPFEVVGSSVGAMYLRFASGAERDSAIDMQPFTLDEARINLFPEETFGRVPRHARVCALVSATGFQAEHVNPAGIAGMFCSFGKVLEIDPITLAGHDMTVVRAVLLMHHTRDAPCDIWPVGGPWDSRVATISVDRTWPSARSYSNSGAYIPLFPPPPPPPFMHNRGHPPFLGVPMQRRLGPGPSSDAERRGHNGGAGRQLAMLLRLHGAPPLAGPEADAPSSPPAPQPLAPTSESPWSRVSSRRSRVTITEIVDGDE